MSNKWLHSFWWLRILSTDWCCLHRCSSDIIPMLCDMDDCSEDCNFAQSRGDHAVLMLFSCCSLSFLSMFLVPSQPWRGLLFCLSECKHGCDATWRVGGWGACQRLCSRVHVDEYRIYVVKYILYVDKYLVSAHRNRVYGICWHTLYILKNTLFILMNIWYSSTNK